MVNIKKEADEAALNDNQTDGRSPLSRPIDWYRTVASSEFDRVIDAIIVDAEKLEARKRNRSESTKAQLVYATEALVLDLYSAWKADQRLEIGISKNKNDYIKADGVKTLPVTYVAVMYAWAGLEKLGYMETVRKGYLDRESGKGRRTRIRASRKLIDLLEGKAKLIPFAIRDRADREVIVMRDCEKKPVAFTHNDMTQTASDNLRSINDCLFDTWIDLYITDAEFNELRRRQLGKSEKDNSVPSTVDFGARSLRRIFNNNSWEEGGRFYGGWWQNIPKEYRKYIHINGKSTVERDFSGMHPAMMYAEAGTKLPTDPYDIGEPKVERATIKRAFNALINAPNNRIEKPNEYDEKVTGLTWRELLEKIRKHHHPIRKHFNTGYGLKLQKTDADIAETVMLKFTGMDYPCLPVHDSFIVHHALVDELDAIMSVAYETIVRSSSEIDGETPWAYEPTGAQGFIDMGDVDDMLGHGEYQEYERRRHEWSAYMGTKSKNR